MTEREGAGETPVREERGGRGSQVTQQIIMSSAMWDSQLPVVLMSAFPPKIYK